MRRGRSLKLINARAERGRHWSARVWVVSFGGCSRKRRGAKCAGWRGCRAAGLGEFMDGERFAHWCAKVLLGSVATHAFALAPPPMPEDSERVFLREARIVDGSCVLEVLGDNGSARALRAAKELCEKSGELSGKYVEIRFEMAPLEPAECQGVASCKAGEFARRVYFARASDG